VVADPGNAEQTSLQHIFSYNAPGAEDFGSADNAGLHGNWDFDGPQTLAAQDQQNADILVVEQTGGGGGQHRHGGMIVGAKAGRDVFKFQIRQPAEITPGEAPGGAGPFRESANADIRLATGQGFKQCADAVRFMLTVGVEGDGGAVALAQGVAQAGLRRSPSPELNGIWAVASVLQSSMTTTGQFHNVRTWATISPTVAASLWAGIRAMGRSWIAMIGIMMQETWKAQSFSWGELEGPQRIKANFRLQVQVHAQIHGGCRSL